MFKPAFLSALLIVLSSTAHAGSVTLGPAAVLSGGDYSTGGGLTVAVEARAIEGKLGLCGVWAQSEAMSAYTRRAAPRVLARGIVLIDGKVVARNLNFLKRVRPSASYTGAPSACTVLNRPWSARDTANLSVRIPRQKVFLMSESRRQGGPRVFFTRSDKVNPAIAKGSLLPASITSYSSSTTHY